MKQIEVIIPRDGISTGKRQVKFETKGFVGSTCKAASSFLEAALGTVTEDEPTNEMYAQDHGVERLREDGNGG